MFGGGVINSGFTIFQDCVYGSVQMLGPGSWDLEKSIMGPWVWFHIGPSIPRQEFRQREALDRTVR